MTVLGTESESDKPNAYHESHRFVFQVLGTVLGQLCSERFYLSSSVGVQTR